MSLGSLEQFEMDHNESPTSGFTNLFFTNCSRKLNKQKSYRRQNAVFNDNFIIFPQISTFQLTLESLS